MSTSNLLILGSKEGLLDRLLEEGYFRDPKYPGMN
jgi:hypothetical protein